MGKFFAWMQIALAIGAVIGYCHIRDWKHAVYWLLAGLITYVVTTM